MSRLRQEDPLFTDLELSPTSSLMDDDAADSLLPESSIENLLDDDDDKHSSSQDSVLDDLVRANSPALASLPVPPKHIKIADSNKKEDVLRAVAFDDSQKRLRTARPVFLTDNNAADQRSRKRLLVRLQTDCMVTFLLRSPLCPTSATSGSESQSPICNSYSVLLAPLANDFALSTSAPPMIIEVWNTHLGILLVFLF